MNEEMEALEKNKTWELVDLSTGKKSMKCKQVYTFKYRTHGTLERYKVRLVAKEYTQTYDVDYLEKFALVSTMNIINYLFIYLYIFIFIIGNEL